MELTEEQRTRIMHLKKALAQSSASGESMVIGSEIAWRYLEALHVLLATHNDGAQGEAETKEFRSIAEWDKRYLPNGTPEQPEIWRLSEDLREAVEWAAKQAASYPQPIVGESLMGKRARVLRSALSNAAHPQPITDAARDAKRYHGRTLEDLKEICTTRPARYPQAHHDFDKTILALIAEIERLDRAKGE